MIKIEKAEVMGWEAAVRGARNPMNSWDRLDSVFINNEVKLGPNDYKLLTNLAKAGSDHRKFMRMIVVYVDITAPLYWWKEADTYGVATVKNSCSTMHKIHAKEFTMDDFSHEHLMEFGYDKIRDPKDVVLAEDIVNDVPFINVDPLHSYDNIEGAHLVSPRYMLTCSIHMLNQCRDKYLQTKDKKYWWQMIQLLPSSYNQKRTVMLNYEVLKNMYHARKNHKLDEWCELREWIKALPYSELITGEEM